MSYGLAAQPSSLRGLLNGQATCLPPGADRRIDQSELTWKSYCTEASSLVPISFV